MLSSVFNGLVKWAKKKTFEKKIFKISGGGYRPGSDERAVEIPWAISCYCGERRVLEVGCGFCTPEYIERLKALPIEELHGIDISSVGCPDFIKKTADIRDTGYDTGYFDMIFCVSTIEHVGMDNGRYLPAAETVSRAKRPDVESILEMKRILKSGGKLVLTMPFGKSKDYGWFIQYDKNMLDSLLKASGMRLLRKDFFKYDNGWCMCAEKELSHLLYNDNEAPAACGAACVLLTK